MSKKYYTRSDMTSWDVFGTKKKKNCADQAGLGLLQKKKK